MTFRRQGPIVVGLCLLNSLRIIPQDISETPADIQELIGTVISESSDSVDDSSDFISVLDFLTSAYSEHGYRETGSWIAADKTYRYVPYKGELPEYAQSDFRWPVRGGKITSGYGYRPKYKRFHRGLDISLNKGDTVRSALPGVVTRTGFDAGGFGIYIVVAHHGAIETIYGHLSGCIASPGKAVAAGEPIAIGGSTGNSTGPHLHFETRYRGTPLDPVSWFNL